MYRAVSLLQLPGSKQRNILIIFSQINLLLEFHSNEISGEVCLETPAGGNGLLVTLLLSLLASGATAFCCFAPLPIRRSDPD
ncbi:hypothetical protein S1OALGB6SA_796 [Olavius algarvensis spirochete endosymbiont]|nr:hypothetical protein S1OALGB6SA_796 [Olavius algarvensis spirochete endosymbiont]